MTDTPTARRASAPGWRDPRLWIGVAIVAASVLVGALVLGTSDDTVAVWAATDAMGPGHALTADDLTVRRVGFADAADASLYFGADEQLPSGLRLLHGVAAGELLPRAAVGSGDAARAAPGARLGGLRPGARLGRRGRRRRRLPPPVDAQRLLPARRSAAGARSWPA